MRDQRADDLEEGIKPLRGNILDIGGSISIPDKEKPIDFHKVREDMKKELLFDYDTA